MTRRLVRIERAAYMVLVVTVLALPVDAKMPRKRVPLAPAPAERVRDNTTGNECPRSQAASVSWAEQRADPRADAVRHVEWTCMPGLPPAK